MNSISRWLAGVVIVLIVAGVVVKAVINVTAI